MTNKPSKNDLPLLKQEIRGSKPTPKPINKKKEVNDADA